MRDTCPGALSLAGASRAEPLLTDSAAAAVAGPGWSGSAAALAEQRDATVHSSMAKVKVVLESEAM